MAEERPNGVPEGATCDGREWELAPTDDQGRKHGLVTWWRLDGTKCCETEFRKGSPSGRFQRFHENGEVSREGEMAAGRIVGMERWHRSTGKTSEYFGVYSAGRKVFTAEVDHTAGTRAFYHRDGTPCDQKGKAIVVEEASDLPEHWQAPPASSSPAPWEAPTFDTELVDGVFFTDALRRAILPRRGGIATPIRPLPDVETAWSAFRDVMWANDGASLTHRRNKDQHERSQLWSFMASDDARKRQLADRLMDPSPRVGSVDDDASLCSQMLERYSGAVVVGAFSDLSYARAADFLAASVGLPEACYRALMGLDDELPYQRMGIFERLRELLVIADEGTYAAARDRIEAGYAEAMEQARNSSYAGRTPAHLSWAVSFLVPVPVDGVDPLAQRFQNDALAYCLGRGFGNDPLNAGGLAGTDLDGLARFRKANERVRHEFYAGGDRIYLAGVLDQARGAAVSAIAEMKLSSPFEDDANYNGRWLFLLAHFDDDAALAPMVQEHEAGWPWGAQALALARSLRGDSVDAYLKKHAPALLDVVLQTEPLTGPLPKAVDLGNHRTPSPYVPSPTLKLVFPTPRVEVPVTVDWRPQEREDASLGHPPDWNGVELPEVDEEGHEAWIAHRERWAIPTDASDLVFAKADHIDRLLALGCNPRGYHTYSMGGALLRLGARGVPFLAAMLEQNLADYLAFAQPFGSALLAPAIVRGFAGKAQKAPSRAWIVRHPRAAWVGAFGMVLPAGGEKKVADKKAAAAGERALRYLSGHGHRDAMLSDAASIGAAEPIQAILDEDPLSRPKAKLPKLPAFAKPSALPGLTEAGKAVDDDAVQHLLLRLAVSNADEVHPAVQAARGSLDPASGAAFAWALFQAWLAAGADPKQVWCMHAVGFFGGDDEVRQLAALAKGWPGNKASARAQLALDTLLAAGSETALVQIHLLAEKSKYPGFKKAAAQRIALLAEARGLSVDALQDRLVPRLGLDEEGGAVLDYGPRQFTVAFDEQLRPLVRDGDGKLRKSLPKPAASDDAELAKAAKKRLSGLKKDVKALASILVSRLERAMVTQRALEGDVFLEHLAQHPLTTHLARRLVWQVVGGEAFRVAEDGTLAGIDDEPFELAAGEEVIVAHPLMLDESARRAWQEVFVDYELLPPFEQLTRAVYRPDDGVLDGLVGAAMPYGRLRGLGRGAWVPWADSWIATYSRSVGPGVDAIIDFEPGYSPAGDEHDDQKLTGVRPHGVDGWSEVDPALYSEVVRDLVHATES